MRTAGIVAAAFVSTVALWGARAGQARADTRAWTAARAALPTETKVVVGIDVVAVVKTQLFATYYPKLHDKPDAAKVIDAIKDGCKLDPVNVVQSVVFATSDDQEDGVIYVAFSGVDKTKLSSCLQATAKTDDKDAKVGIKHTGNITEVTKGSDTAYFGWVGKDVLVVPFKATDKASLVKWMGGKGALAKAEISKSIAKVNTGAAVWGAGQGAKEIMPGANTKGGYGAVTYTKGTLSADVHAVMVSSDQATKAAKQANDQLTEAKGGALPPQFTAMLNAVTVSADKDEVRIKANLAEADVLGALAVALGAFGGP